MEDGAEIRRLHRSERVPIREIGRRLGVAAGVDWRTGLCVSLGRSPSVTCGSRSPRYRWVVASSGCCRAGDGVGVHEFCPRAEDSHPSSRRDTTLGYVGVDLPSRSGAENLGVGPRSRYRRQWPGQLCRCEVRRRIGVADSVAPHRDPEFTGVVKRADAYFESSSPGTVLRVASRFQCPTRRVDDAQDQPAQGPCDRWSSSGSVRDRLPGDDRVTASHTANRVAQPDPVGPRLTDRAHND